MKINNRFLSLIISSTCAVSLFCGIQSVTAQTDTQTSSEELPIVTVETEITETVESTDVQETTIPEELAESTSEASLATDTVESATELETVETTVVTDLVETYAETQTTTVTKKIAVDLSNIKKNPELQWYYADEKEFYIDGIKVTVDGKEVDATNIITFNTTPASTYDGKNFNYIIPLTVTYEGQTATAEMNVKIGQRGDANCDNIVNIRDASAIANDLAQLYSTKVTQFTEEDGFGIFLGNSDEDIAQTEHYGKFNLNIKDASNLAYYSAVKFANKNLTLYKTLWV